MMSHEKGQDREGPGKFFVKGGNAQEGASQRDRRLRDRTRIARIDADFREFHLVRAALRPQLCAMVRGMVVLPVSGGTG